MSDPREQRLREWFAAACDLPEAEQEAFLEQGLDDAELRAEVLDLLRRDRDGGLPLDQPLLRATQREAMVAIGSEGPVPDAIADYRVVRLIGRGSMGTVYEATQPGTGARVAVKVLRTGMPSAALLSRFRREAELLARLDHPFIARIHESGSADLGPASHPFIAMELVSGTPLDDYARARTLSVRETLELVSKIAEGVEHAHARGVVHRDLKPSNVLVDERGDPRLIDFGVARALAVDQEAGSLQTATGQLIGTLQYMAPEQVVGSPSEVDGRADVYALGVIGYELLAGRPPYDVARDRLSDALQRVRAEEPPLLGTLRGELRGDVEAIFARALEKDPADRYANVGAFLADLRAHLAELPVVARTPGTWEQLRRFASRNPGLVRAAAVIAILVALGLTGTGWGWREALAKGDEVEGLLDEQRELTRRAEEARIEAEEAYRESEVVLAYLEEMFETLRYGWKGPEVQLRDVLLPAAEELDRTLIAHDRAAARLNHTLGLALFTVAEYDAALARMDEVVAGVGHPRDLRVLSARMHRALVWIARGEYPLAEGELRDVQRLVPEGEDEVAARAGIRLVRVLVLSGQLAEAEAELVALDESGVLDGLPASFAEDADVELANILVRRGDYRRAEALYREVYAALRERLGVDHVRTLEVGEAYAGMLLDLKRFDEAEPMLAERARFFTDRAGPEHPQTLHARGRLALLYVEARRFGEVVDELRELVDASRRVLGEDHPRTVALLTSLSVSALQTGAPDGVELTEAALELGRSVYGPNDARLVATIINACYLRYSQGNLEGAIELANEGLRVCAEAPGVSAMDEFSLVGNLAGFLMVAGRLAEAETLIRDTLPRIDATLGEQHEIAVNLTYYLAEAARSAGRYDEALLHYDRVGERDPEARHPCQPGVARGREQALAALEASWSEPGSR